MSRIPQKMNEPIEISNLICFLLSDLSDYINGASINITEVGRQVGKKP